MKRNYCLSLVLLALFGVSAPFAANAAVESVLSSQSTQQAKKITGKVLAYIIHSGFISGYQNRYGDNLKPPTNVYHRMTA